MCFGSVPSARLFLGMWRGRPTPSSSWHAGNEYWEHVFPTRSIFILCLFTFGFPYCCGISLGGVISAFSHQAAASELR